MQKNKTSFKNDLRQRCYGFSLDIIALIDELPKKRAAWVIGDQLLRSATSIGANLVEAKASSSRLEYKKYYEISLKSANESAYWLGLLRDAKLATGERIGPLEQELDELTRMIATGVMHLKERKF